jgi:hypothetical protein
MKLNLPALATNIKILIEKNLLVSKWCPLQLRHLLITACKSRWLLQDQRRQRSRW